MGEPKERLDVLLVKRAIFPSREKARASIMAGEIFVDGRRSDKCGESIKVEASVEFKGESPKYVSRGGLKLEKAVAAFKLNLKDKVCLDIGASTGGFTDCMLQSGAKKVFSIDVGYGQFAWKLRMDERVVCLERTNIRYVTPDKTGEMADFASIDVSFISLRTVLPAIINLLKEDGEIVALIKPQFEAGREKVGKKGVVREKTTHIEVIEKIINYIEEKGLNILNLGFSPIKGPEGNIEYLVYFTKDSHKESEYIYDNINQVVTKAHEKL